MMQKPKGLFLLVSLVGFISLVEITAGSIVMLISLLILNRRSVSSNTDLIFSRVTMKSKGFKINHLD
jgi:hypothetical protein